MTTLLIGHRGVAGKFPENTKVSVQAAIDLGLNWVEVDVQPTKDNVLVVCHDHTVNRCSNGKGRVDQMTLSELKALDFGRWFGDEFANESIMTLSELLELAAENDLNLNIEVKVDHHSANDVAQMAAKTLLDGPLPKERILLSSFSHDVIRALHKHCEGYRLGVLSEFFSRKDRLLLEEVDAYSCNLNINWVRSRQINKLQKAGYKVMCYTVNNPKKLKHLPMLDGIFSDHPSRFM
ncbi:MULTISPECIES: glycerophosphodiester phosphodiesterase family protein [Vibrio]|jgi:glycerophosphoryl diester phosphodiesterase|uniref:glycerophosphodiester phosphodiesterase family protein n=1 Tax=Vibrio TaxID=662 RepID=UPI00039DAEF5|nr:MULTISPECIES: glycerophosphodiester phosphodiesterase family protein [Vibrio]MCX2792704.1 glycerophosphodiester phosphodiesterase family protein [Vibrio sp. Sgm 5]PMO35989.1 glycerophosphoryl diester phosphodiesterase [Vibrio sp. 10N.222.52.B12]PQJ71045.1 glycerophosphoryl diester phosphodiesterase [Vibrio jasicida]UQA53182.1 glycerophosphoryl diester phosphodiesterase [Vibrio sp. ED002]CAH1523902.1 Glycerophosphoryl diester phosphodiesterase [Vibrio jasicida]